MNAIKIFCLFKHAMWYVVLLILVALIGIYLYLFPTQQTLVKNTGEYQTLDPHRRHDSNTTVPNLHTFQSIPQKYMTDKNIASNTTLQTYNLEEIDKIAKFLVKNLNTSKHNCFKLIQIHRVKKEVDTNDILAYSLDMFVYDTMKNFGTLIRGVVYQISGKYKIRELKQITPMPLSALASNDDGFSFEPLVSFGNGASTGMPNDNSSYFGSPLKPL